MNELNWVRNSSSWIKLTWKAWMRERSMMEGLLVWTPAMDSRRPRLWKDRLTVREARESLVTKSVGQVSLTQLKPMDFIPFEMTSTGFLLSPSATTASKWDTQLTQASFTLRPSWSRIHRESVWRRPVTGTVLSWSTSSNVEESNAIISIGAERTVKTNVLDHHLPISISYDITWYSTAKQTNMLFTEEIGIGCLYIHVGNLCFCVLFFCHLVMYLPSLSHLSNSFVSHDYFTFWEITYQKILL